MAAGETETTQEHFQDWLQLDKGVPRFQLLVFLYLFSSALPILLHFPFICFLSVFLFCLLGQSFALSGLSLDHDDPSPQLLRISEGLLQRGNISILLSV
jgi:hypothetical protein